MGWAKWQAEDPARAPPTRARPPARTHVVASGAPPPGGGYTATACSIACTAGVAKAVCGCGAADMAPTKSAAARRVCDERGPVRCGLHTRTRRGCCKHAALAPPPFASVPCLLPGRNDTTPVPNGQRTTAQRAHGVGDRGGKGSSHMTPKAVGVSGISFHRTLTGCVAGAWRTPRRAAAPPLDRLKKVARHGRRQGGRRQGGHPGRCAGTLAW